TASTISLEKCARLPDMSSSKSAGAEDPQGRRSLPGCRTWDRVPPPPPFFLSVRSPSVVQSRGIARLEADRHQRMVDGDAARLRAIEPVGGNRAEPFGEAVGGGEPRARADRLVLLLHAAHVRRQRQRERAQRRRG